jgi:serine/threonine-protein kinase
VQVYDHGVMQDGRPFIVMEFLAGEPLDARLDREGRVSPRDTAQIMSQVCRALARAHAGGIVHRDLKPENIFLVWDEEDQAIVAKVVDFGIAKFTDKQAGVSSSTRTGSVLGTPFYMSPEQARGLRTIDHRTDLWSLAVIVYRCMVGRLPFEGESIGDLLVKICTAPIPVPSSVAPDCPAGFDGWFARALQRDPNERFASAQEFSEHLMFVCGLTGSRPALSSEQLGYANAGVQAGLLPGQMTPAGGVPGVTAQRTDTVFSRTSNTGPNKKSALVWVGIGSVVGVGLLVAAGVHFATRGSTEPQTVQQVEPAKTVGAAPASSIPSNSPMAPSGSSVAVAAQVVLVAPTNSAAAIASSPSAQPKPLGADRTPPIAVRPVPVRPLPPNPVPAGVPNPPPTRPQGARPIDVGY